MTTLTEAETRDRYITPGILRAGWNAETQVLEEVSFTKGRIIVRGKQVSRGQGKRADYILQFKPNIPLAVVEAKDAQHSVGDGIQQALGYAETLDIPFVFSSNGSGFTFHDRTGQSDPKERFLGINQFPSPSVLWEKYCSWKGLPIEQQKIVTQDYHDYGTGKAPRYYQVNAVNAVIEAIARGQNRVLLVMATGTGKTYTAFQIIWRLWKSGTKKRILFLADRNILIDQTMVNDFRPFSGKMAKLSTASKTIERSDGTRESLTLALDKARRIDTSYEIYLGLYQAITGPEESEKLYKEFSRGFFDLIVIDECHRGSAADDAAWREILEHFDGATQIGMTATPKETKYVSNINYFGKPVYSYSLRQGIDDGFLAPYKVVRVHIDKDIDGYTPEEGKTDRFDQPIEKRAYNTKDFDRTIVIDGRTKVVAERITQFLKESGDRFQKTIVFCVDEEHADRMRQALVNENKDLCDQNSKYVMRITGSDTEGKAQLGTFIDPESKYPVIVTSSRLLTTGVDAQTCRCIVIDREVGSMTEFKQIIGRGTRIHEDTKKYYFTLIDFRGVTKHFKDKAFDGDPIQIYEPKPGQPIDPPEGAGETPGSGGGEEPGAPSTPGADGEQAPTGQDGLGEDETILVPKPPPGGGLPIPPGQPRQKIYVDGVNAWIVLERVEYLDEDGKLITESLRDFTKRALLKRFASLAEFLNKWTNAERKQAVIEELTAEGLALEPLAEEVGKDLDAFDLICHVAFDKPPLTRRERANNVRKRDIFTKYGPQARAVLEALLTKYQDQGLLNLDDPKVLAVPPFDTMGTPFELIKQFGGRPAFEKAVRDLQAALYENAA